MNDNPRSSPSVAGQQASRIAGVVLAGFPLVILVTTLAIRHICDWPLWKSFLVATGSLWAVIFTLFIAVWLYARSRAGRLLLDCTQFPHKRFLLLLSAIWGFLAVLSSVAIVVAAFFGKKDVQTYLFFFALYFASSASCVLIMALGRLQIVENGIWRYFMLLEWDRIASYDWQGEEEPTLMLRLRGRSSGRDPLPVPLEHRDALDELLRQNVYFQQDDFEAPLVENGTEGPPSP